MLEPIVPIRTLSVSLSPKFTQVGRLSIAEQVMYLLIYDLGQQIPTQSSVPATYTNSMSKCIYT